MDSRGLVLRGLDCTGDAMSDSMRPSASDPVPDDVRDCDHGNRWGKCYMCGVLAEIAELQARLATLEAAIRAHRAAWASVGVTANMPSPVADVDRALWALVTP